MANFRYTGADFSDAADTYLSSLLDVFNAVPPIANCSVLSAHCELRIANCELRIAIANC